MLIDLLVVMGVGLVMLLGFVALGVIGAGSGVGGFEGVGIIAAFMFALWFVVSWGYRVYYEGFRDGQTIGKRAMRIRVVQDGGFPVTFRAAAVRNLIRVLDMQPGITWGVAGAGHDAAPAHQAAGRHGRGNRGGARPHRPADPRRPGARHLGRGGPAACWATRSSARCRCTCSAAPRSSSPCARSSPPRSPSAWRPRVDADPRRLQVTADQFLGMVYEEESLRRRASGAGGRAGSGQATGLFRRQKPMWDSYQRMLDEAGGAGLARMGETRVSRFAAMYREVAADLARARTYGGSPELLFTLERAVGAGHNLLYRAPARRWTGVRRWVMGGFPALVRLRWRPIALAAALLYIPAVLTFAAVRQDPGLGRSMIGPQMMERAEQAEARQARGKGYVSPEDFGGSPIMASTIMVNNVKVTFMAYAGGLLAGVGTVLTLVFNGISVGAVTGVFANYDANLQLWSFLLVHGVIELTAICIAGGAGLWLGSAFLLPGRLTRGQALVRRGRESVSLIGGTAVMLFVAGIIEGFVSPSDLPAEAKLVLAAMLGAAMVAWLALAGRDEAARLSAEAAAER